MSSPDFIHLVVHSEYSLIDGMVRLDDLMTTLQAHQMPAVALTDVMNLFALVKFYKTCIASGIKPIIGADCWVENEKKNQAPHRLLFLCQNEMGYRTLCELISHAYRENQHHDKAILKKEWLTPDTLKNLIALSPEKGEVGDAITRNDLPLAKQLAAEWQARMPHRFYLALSRIGSENENLIHSGVIGIAQDLCLPIVAHNDVRFLEAEDFDAHEARVGITSGYQLDDEKRPKHYFKAQYFKSQESMQALFADYPVFLKNSVEIAKRCTVTLELGKSFLPKFPVPEGFSIENYLVHQSRDGLLKRIAFSQKKGYPLNEADYHARLETELSVINAMGFPGYFLIVADFIGWAKKNDVPVGPGRGSGAGSLVAYALGITDLDPLQYDLLFERFLNPERVSMPDFDVDFCMEGRDRVIEYVMQKYGFEAVSQIVTYGTMAAKAVIRDVGRVLGFPYGFVDKLAKLIPFEIGITLEKALNDEPVLKSRYEEEEDVQSIINLAKKLEGITRNVGKHAGGVVIAPSKLTDFTPIYCEPGSLHLMSQFDKDDVEAVGLVKFDFLGLKTLTLIDWAIKAINASSETKLDITEISLTDEKTFSLLKSHETTAIFQLESRGMKDLIRRLQPDQFEDIIALVALFRPGPLQSGMVDDFINRKHGRANVAYPHPDLEPILSPTYGVILYQEQVMQIAQVLAGYTLGGADLLRRAMGKKKPEEMAQQREIFLSGSVARGVNADNANHIFDLMEKFAGYGFNKSHSAAYALVSYQTAWLKAHYPAAFMAAVLSADMHQTDKVMIMAEEVKRLKIKLIPPDINRSEWRFKYVDPNTMLYGLGALKGVGEAAVLNYIKARESGPFKGLEDFCCRIDIKSTNRRMLEALIKAGAFDSFCESRSHLLSELDGALKSAEQQHKAKHTGQFDLFSMFDVPKHNAPPIQKESFTARLQFEKESLGFYLSGHPLDVWRLELKQAGIKRLSDIQPKKGVTVFCAGQIIAMKLLTTKRDERMASFTLSDGGSTVDGLAFPDIFTQYRDELVKDNVVLIEGEASHDDFSGGVRVAAKRILPIAMLRHERAKFLQLVLNQDFLRDQANIQKLKSTLVEYKDGKVAVKLSVLKEGVITDLALPQTWHIQPDANLIDTLKAWLGQEQVSLIF